MPTLCTQCGFNWAHLKSIDGDGEETYEVCPECGTDCHLLVSDAEVTFIKSAITGEITNLSTGKSFVFPLAPITIKPWKGNWEDNYKAKEEREDKAINSYHAALAAGTDGEEAYRESFNASK